MIMLVVEFDIAPDSQAAFEVAMTKLAAESLGKEKGTFTPEWEAAVKAMLPLKRWGSPEDIGQAAVFFAGRRGNYVTGQTIAVSGGFGV